MDKRVSLIDLEKRNLNINGINFFLIDCIGYGGLSLVYKAKLGDSYVIIKELYPCIYESNIHREKNGCINWGDINNRKIIVESFKSEYSNLLNRKRTIEQLNPICYGELNGTSYIAMSYVEGRTLFEFLKEDNQYMTIEEMLEILISVSTVVNIYFHKNNYVHLDITPRNIYLLENSTGRKIIKLLDYGCVTRNGEIPLIKTRSNGYSPYDMYKEEGITFYYDIFAICAILYRMLSGVEFRTLDNVDDLELDFEFSKNTYWKKLPKKCKVGIISIIKKGLTIHKSNRYTNIELLIDDLNKCLEYTKNRVYIDSNLNYYFFTNKKTYSSYYKEGLTWYYTNNYSFAVNELVSSIRSVDKTSNISVVKWMGNIDETLEYLEFVNPNTLFNEPPSAGLFHPLNTVHAVMSNSSENIYIIIFGIDSFVDIENIIYYSNLKFIFVSNKEISLPVAPVKIIDDSYEVNSKCSDYFTAIFELVNNKGIRYCDIINILKELNLDCFLHYLFEDNCLYIVNGYCYLNDEIFETCSKNQVKVCEFKVVCVDFILSYISRKLSNKVEDININKYYAYLSIEIIKSGINLNIRSQYEKTIINTLYKNDNFLYTKMQFEILDYLYNGNKK